LNLKFQEKLSYKGTDVMSFRFSRIDDHNYLNYRPGQFSVVDLGTKEDPKGPTRSFSIASSPTERDAILITTRIRDTPFKQKLSRLEEGTAVKITAPAGKFTLPQDHSKPLVFLSGGIGVTPFRSMIKYATDKQLPLKITMFDSNRNPLNILYKDEFDSCVKINENLRIIYTITEEGEKIPSSDWKGERGFIDEAMLAKYLTKDDLANSIFYICGPPAMLNAMQQLLSKEIEVPQDRIKIEVFTGY
jgi:ferredoxin-NADP reductase